MLLPKLPAKAAYLLLNNPARRNALSLAVLENLRAQLLRQLTSPKTGRLLLLPAFYPSLLRALENAGDEGAKRDKASNIAPTDASSHDRDRRQYGWLVNASDWNEHRLPKVLVLRSSNPDGRIFSSGHDLHELASLGPGEVRRTFALCAELMSLIRRSPAPVVSVVHGLATAAGLQLALTADLVIASSESTFQLPGARLGLPCTSPATAVSRRLPAGLARRMLLTAEPVPASDVGEGVEVVPTDHLEDRVARTVETLACGAGQPAALGKWAFWTQIGMRGDLGGGDGYEEAAAWAGRVMALHAQSEDAREGMAAFAEKRPPVWKT